MRRSAILSLAGRPVAWAPAILLADRFHCAVCAAFFLAVTLEARAAQQAPYTFINIADDSGSLTSIEATFSMNSSGVVAFRATGPNGRTIYAGKGGPLTAIVASTGSFSRLEGVPAINDHGTIAFIGYLGDINATRGIYTVKDGTVSPIVQGGLYELGLYPGLSINANGKVAFVALISSVLGVYASDGGPITTIALGGQQFVYPPPFASINNCGTVAFNDESPIGDRVRAGDGGTLAVVEHAGGRFSSFRSPSINDHGDVAFIAELDTGASGVFVRSEGNTHTIADTNGRFGDFADYSHHAPSVAINNSGSVAFIASLDFSASLGIYTGPNPIAHKVIRSGDLLFGSVLLQLDSYPAINSRGDIAFKYQLANGISGIAVARVVPEPGSAAIVIATLAMFVIRAPGARRPGSLG